MRNIKEQTESIQLSIYCNIICQTLQLHENLSICKMVTFSYLIKQNRFLGGTIYTAKNTQDIIFKGISLLAGDFGGFCNSVPYILKALHILINKGIVSSENDVLTLTTNDLKLDSVYEENNFMKKVIEESKTMTDRQFMKEVTYNV
ncbi:MAG: hypothetical protein Q8882_03565 [Bacillota bacterium]|nr:hypothetical protein [Bacillota bacterium]